MIKAKLQCDRGSHRDAANDGAINAEMIEKRAEVLRGLFHADASFWSKRSCLAMTTAVERQQTNSIGRLEKFKRLVHVGAEAVLKNEGNTAADFAIMEANTVMFKKWHAS